MPSHVHSLDWVGYFEAPGVRPVTPVQILDHCELVEVLTDGVIFFDAGAGRQSFTKGAMFWHMAGEWTIFDTPREAPYRCIAFEFAVDPPTRLVPRVTIWNDPEEAVCFCTHILEIFHEGSYDAAALCDMVYSKFRWEGVNARQLGAPQLPKTLRKACKFLETNLSMPITPDDAAQAADISRPHLFRLFKEFLATSPHQYLLQLRLGKAKLLLAKGRQQSIKEIANECGFDSIEGFYRSFRGRVKLTPAEYRQQYALHRD